MNLFSFESKSMTQASNLTGDPLPSLGSNMILRPMEGNHLSALIPTTIVGSGSVTYMREASPLSSSGSFGFQSEGSAKPQIDYNIVTINQELQFLAATCKVSRQFLSNVPELQSYLSRSLSEDYKNALDTYCYQSLTANAVAGVSSESVAAARLLDYSTQAAWAGRGVSGIAIGVSAWAKVLKSAPSSGPYSVPGGVTFTPEGGIFIFSYPVYVIPSMPPNSVLIGNFARGCSLAQSTIFSLRTSDSNEDDFVKNMLTVRAESLLTLMVYSPSAFVSGTIS
jgi:HK97 family phage major capsid protein